MPYGGKNGAAVRRRTPAACLVAVLLAVGCCACGPGTATGQATPTDPVTGADRASWPGFLAWLNQRAQAGTFSGAVLVTEDGVPVVRQAGGFADVARQRANTIDTRFNIGSIGKTFTAVAIAQLVEQGKLAFDAPVGRYVPGFPSDVGREITVEMLLTHTSGLVNVRRHPPQTPPMDISEALTWIVGEPPAFEPGSRFGYSNTNYIVLGAVVEAVTGQDYYEYVREHVFVPAGMTHTGWYTLGQAPGMAHAYLPGDTPARPQTWNDIGIGGPAGNPSGGAYSTVGDLTRFAAALLEHRLLGPAMTETVLTGRVDTGRPGPAQVSRYGYGFEVEHRNGVRIVGHSGGAPGVDAQLRIYPEAGCVVVILANLDRSARAVYDRINRILAP
ncbi:MAG: beta-lactamase family protein [Actinomycetia bacterium]|nr:beta-lactamase family protein [Actinomycetes bacterium]